MAYHDIEIKFPCGYEVKSHISAIFGLSSSFNEHSLLICPIHGKGCKANLKEANKKLQEASKEEGKK